MNDRYDDLLFAPNASPECVCERLNEDPQLEHAWLHWRALRRRLHRDLNERLPDRHLLVLYALDEAGCGAALSTEERRALTAVRSDIEKALDEHPALESVVNRIQEDRKAFVRVWAEQVDGTTGTGQHSVTAVTDSPSTRREERSPSDRRTKRRRQWVSPFITALVFVALVVSAVLFWPTDSSTTTVEVADGTTRVVELGDGSSVRLIGSATLTYASDLPQTATRRVILETGRAYFDVQRPSDEGSFVVQTPTARTTVLGTQFGVETGRDSTAVTLAEGRVRLEAIAASEEKNPVTLEPGQRSWVVAGRAPSSPSSTDLSRALDWTGLFVFRSTPLETLVDRLSQHYDVRIDVEPALRSERVTGTFEREQSVLQVLETVAATLGARLHRPQEDRFRIEPGS